MSASERSVAKGVPPDAGQISEPKDAGSNSKRAASLGLGSVPGLVPSILKEASAPQDGILDQARGSVLLPDITGVSPSNVVYSATTKIVGSEALSDPSDTPDSHEKPKALYSGMEVGESLARAELDAIFNLINEEMNTEGIDMFSSYEEVLTAANIPRINELANTPIEGVEILRGSDYGTENMHQRSCEFFTFGSMLQQQWANSFGELAKLADEYEQSDFLEEKGYVIVEDEAPRTGDIVAYVDETADSGGWRSPPFLHYGILTPEGKVISRFGQGPIVRHEIDAVPSSYGDRVYFLRNSENTVIPRDAEGFESYLQQVLEAYQDTASVAVSEQHEPQTKIPKRIAFQAFNPERTSQSAEKLLAVADGIGPEFHARFIGNPFSPEAVSILADHYQDTAMSHSDIVRALILAEPEGEYDRRMQQIPRDERKKTLQEEFVASSEMAQKFSTYILDKDRNFWDMSDGEIYENISKEIFGINDQDQINSQFSRGQRRNFRLAIINFINNKNYMQPYLDAMKTKPEETVMSALKSAYKIEDGVTLTGGMTAEVTPYGLIIYLNSKDYTTIVNSRTSGAVRNPDGDPNTILGRLAVIKVNGLDPTAQVARETRAHEVRHLLFNLFLDHTPRYLTRSTQEHLQKIHTVTEGGSFDEELTGHREFAGALREYFNERGKDELIGNLTHTGDYLNPLSTLGSLHFITHLDNVWEYLATRTDLSSDQRQTIYGIYHQKFVHYMEQTSYLQWTARKLYSAKGDTGQAEAMLQLSSPGTARRLGAQVGIDQAAMKSTFIQEREAAVTSFSSSVESAIALYEQGQDDMFNGWIKVDEIKMDQFLGTFPLSLVPTLQKILEKAPYTLNTTTQLIKSTIDVLENILQVHYQDMSKGTVTGILDSLDSVSTRKGPFRQDEAITEAKALKEVIEAYIQRRPDAESFT